MKAKKHFVFYTVQIFYYCSIHFKRPGTKKIILLLLVFASLTINLAAQKKTFLRIYNISGQKIANGFFAGTTGNSILLINDTAVTATPVDQIGTIKTKRTVGHSILLASVITGVIVTIPFVATSGGTGFITYTPAEGAVTGLLLGGGSGALIGAVIGSAKKRQVFEINGNTESWIKIKPLIDQLPVYKIPPAGSSAN